MQRVAARSARRLDRAIVPDDVVRSHDLDLEAERTRAREFQIDPCLIHVRVTDAHCEWRARDLEIAVNLDRHDDLAAIETAIADRIAGAEIGSWPHRDHVHYDTAPVERRASGFEPSVPLP